MLKTKGMTDIQKAEDLKRIHRFYFFSEKKGNLWVVPKPLWRHHGVTQRLASGLLKWGGLPQTTPKLDCCSGVFLLTSSAVDSDCCRNYKYYFNLFKRHTDFSQPVQPNSIYRRSSQWMPSARKTSQTFSSSEMGAMCNYFTFIQKLIMKTLNNKWVSTRASLQCCLSESQWSLKLAVSHCYHPGCWSITWAQKEWRLFILIMKIAS